MAESGTEKKNTKRTGYVSLSRLIFGAVLIYLIAMTVLYFTKEHITSYEVRIGKLSYTISAKGLVLREETVYSADESGDITFYASEADKVRVGSSIYSMGAAGSTAGAIAAFEGEAVLQASDYARMEADLNDFQGSYTPVSFDSTYDFAYRLESELLDIYNRSILNQLQTETSSLQIVHASDDGIIGYTIDGYEDLTEEDIDRKLFDLKDYRKTDIRENTEIREGDPVYKLVTSETWSIILPVKQEDYQYLADKEQDEVEIHIEKDNTALWAAVDYLEIEGQYYLKLTFENSMLRYLSDRFLDVTVIIAEETGLKIPRTAITEKPFYLIPYDYITRSNGANYSVYVRSGSDVTRQAISVYNEDDENEIYWVDCSALEAGTQLVKPDSLEMFTVSETGDLKGVYCINKGFAVFKQIREVYHNEEYSIIEEGTDYGIANFDFIALDSNAVREDDIVY